MRFASIQRSKMRLRPRLRPGPGLGELTDPQASRLGEGKEGQGDGRGGEVDSDAQLEQGRRLAKVGPVSDFCIE